MLLLAVRWDARLCGVLSLIHVCPTALHAHIHIISILLIAGRGMYNVAVVDGETLDVVVDDAWVSLYVHHA